MGTETSRSVWQNAPDCCVRNEIFETSHLKLSPVTLAVLRGRAAFRKPLISAILMTVPNTSVFEPRTLVYSWRL